MKSNFSTATLLAGRVVQAGTDSGIASAQVTLVDTSGAVRTATTDATGAFSFDSLTAGIFSLQVSTELSESRTTQMARARLPTTRPETLMALSLRLMALCMWPPNFKARFIACPAPTPRRLEPQRSLRLFPAGPMASCSNLMSRTRRSLFCSSIATTV